METILSIAGKPGLYKLVSRGKMNLIVEALDDTHKRVPAFASDRVTSLGDIAIYTTGEDIPLWKVLDSVSKKEAGKEVSVNYKKMSGKELRAYFTTSRNCSNGITCWLKPESQTLKLQWLLRKEIILMTEKQKSKLETAPHFMF